MADMLKRQRLIPVDGVIPKHHRKKPKQKGDGSTCAFLGTQTSSLTLFLEYTLCYHAFCKYSSSLPHVLRSDTDLIEYSGRSILLYFSRLIYRGDATIDSRTTKIHAQRRLGHNYNTLGNVMHSCCEVGERLLKTEAKKISRTAQQRGSSTFERQTCSRILDRHLMDKLRLVLESRQNHNDLDPTSVEGKNDAFSRQQPHFVVVTGNAEVWACDRKGKRCIPNESTGNLHPLVVNELCQLQAADSEVHVYNEVMLRDGSYVRAFPTYRGEGPWYDFVNIQWEDVNGTPYLLPAQCLAFYKKDNECWVIIQSVDLETRGKVTGYCDSVLTTHFHMQRNRAGAPVLYTVNCASIDSCVMGICHNPRTTILDHSRSSVTIVRPRNEWAYAWFCWNQQLRVKNSHRTMTKPFVDLGTEDMVSKVRKLIESTISEHGRA